MIPLQLLSHVGQQLEQQDSCQVQLLAHTSCCLNIYFLIFSREEASKFTYSPEKNAKDDISDYFRN